MSDSHVDGSMSQRAVAGVAGPGLLRSAEVEVEVVVPATAVLSYSK